MIKLFSLKNQGKKDGTEQGGGGGSGSSKKTSAAQLRITKGTLTICSNVAYD